MEKKKGKKERRATNKPADLKLVSKGKKAKAEKKPQADPDIELDRADKLARIKMLEIESRNYESIYLSAKERAKDAHSAFEASIQRLRDEIAKDESQLSLRLPDEGSVEAKRADDKAGAKSSASIPENPPSEDHAEAEA